MKNWRDFFTPSIVEKAEEYVKKGKVKGLTHSRKNCMAKVLDQKVCDVRIQGLDREEPVMKCSCREAARGKHCVHEAAVLCALARSTGLYNDASETLYLNMRNSDLNDPGMYFQIGDIIKNAEYAPNARRDVKKLIRTGAVVLDRFFTGYDRDSIGMDSGQYGVVEGHYLDNGIRRSIHLVFSRNRLVEASCNACYTRYTDYSDTSFYYHDKLCTHEAALLEESIRYILKNNPGDETNMDGANLINGFANYDQKAGEESGEINARAGDITVVPKLMRDLDGQLYLSFKAGNDRLYVLKNPSDFLKAYKERKTLTLGKKGVLHFESEDLTESSRKWLRFFENRQLEQDRLNRLMGEKSNFYTYVPQIFKQNMELTGTSLDEFYQCASPSHVEFSDKLKAAPRSSKTEMLEIGDRPLRLSLSVREGDRDERGLKSILVTGSVPELYRGGRDQYFLSDGALSRVDPDKSGDLLPILNAVQNGKAHFVIGRKNLSEFYYRILPRLREADDIEVEEPDQEELEKILPPDSEYTFYLDLDHGRLLMDIIVAYGDQKFRLPADMEKLAKLPYRAALNEARVLDKAEELFQDYNPGSGSFEKEATDDAVYDLLTGGVLDLQRLGEVQVSDDLKRVHIHKRTEVSIGVHIESGLMDLEISTHDMTNEELLELLESYRKKKRFHRLRNGDFVEIERDESLDMLEQILKTSGGNVRDFTKGEMQLPLYRALYLNKLLEEHDDVAADRDKNFKNLIRSFKTIGDSDFEVPGSLAPVMRKYQNFGYKWIRTLSSAGFGGILADEMGLGKTLQMISVLLAEKNEGTAGVSLVVCPASLVYNWIEELHHFAPSLHAEAVSGTAGEREAFLAGLKDRDDVDAIVTSYDLLKRDIRLYQDLTFSYMVLDEAQYIKNPRAAAAKSVKIVKSDHRFALTGTPIENRLSELWSIFDFLMPGFLYTYSEFREEMETPITKYQDKDATERLKKMVSPFILRRYKKDVLKDLPDKIEEVRYAAFEPKQRRIYDAQVVHMKEMLEKSDDHSGRDKLAILGELTKIREICCDPRLVLDHYDGPSAKLEAFMDLVESAVDGGHRMLVFSAFKSMLEILEESLKSKKIPYYKIVGDTKKEERLRLVHEFNHGDVPVFLISLKAGGTGLNLTGADVVIHYDPWWNLAAQNQATDRAHRIGQTKKVSVYRIVVKNTIEEKIIEMQEKKKELADAVLSGETTSLGSLSRDELLELLS